MGGRGIALIPSNVRGIQTISLDSDRSAENLLIRFDSAWFKDLYATDLNDSEKVVDSAENVDKIIKEIGTIHNNLKSYYQPSFTYFIYDGKSLVDACLCYYATITEKCHSISLN